MSEKNTDMVDTRHLPCIKLEGKPEPVVVVPVVRPVPVAIRRPAVPGVVVPAAAT